MKDSLLSTTNVMYVTLPGIDDEPWTDHELAEYQRETCDYTPRPWEYIARLEIEGTTFSGLSTRTTLGNTLRSIAYVYYYAQLAGIEEPWKSNEIAVIASGDDTVAWVHPKWANALEQSIIQHTARTGDQAVIGLG
jgi:hypothetical protein